LQRFLEEQEAARARAVDLGLHVREDSREKGLSEGFGDTLVLWRK
jgi:hypothetical protein